jgi:hypothetical protein
LGTKKDTKSLFLVGLFHFQLTFLTNDCTIEPTTANLRLIGSKISCIIHQKLAPFKQPESLDLGLGFPLEAYKSVKRSAKNVKNAKKY